MPAMNLGDARGPVTRAEIDAAIDRLFELRALTSPDTCTDPENVQCVERKGKNELALWAVHLVNHIALRLCGWAFNHVIGRTVAADDCKSINSHQHEESGRTYEAGANPRLDRSVLVSMLDCHSRTMPAHLEIQAREALQALDLGETRPLVRAEVTGRHHQAYSLAMARLEAIKYAHFLIGQGRKRVVADEMVAKACGVSQHTLRSWQTRYLPQTLGKNRLLNAVDFARRAGEIHRILEVDPGYAKIAEGRTESLDGAGYLTRQILLSKSLSAIGERCRHALSAAKE